MSSSRTPRARPIASPPWPRCCSTISASSGASRPPCIPTPMTSPSTTSRTRISAALEKPASAQAVNDAFRAAASGPLHGILDATDEELVSVDFNGNPHSSIVDLASTAVIDGSMVKVLAWYDNEWGYSNRVKDLIRYMSKSL